MTEDEIERALAHLQHIGTDRSGWSKLYRDGDDQLWELSYPHGELHGGGPRQLAPVDEIEIRTRYPNTNF